MCLGFSSGQLLGRASSMLPRSQPIHGRLRPIAAQAEPVMAAFPAPPPADSAAAPALPIRPDPPGHAPRAADDSPARSRPAPAQRSTDHRPIQIGIHARRTPRPGTEGQHGLHVRLGAEPGRRPSVSSMPVFHPGQHRMGRSSGDRWRQERWSRGGSWGRGSSHGLR